MKTSSQPQHEYRIVPAGEFKAKCLQLMDEVYENRNLTIILTKRGKPVTQMSAAPAGLRLTGPTVHLDDYAVAAVSSSDEATAAVKEHRHKKHKGKKKHK